jgi:anti-sigma factor ChrR (cupin superfamily)
MNDTLTEDDLRELAALYALGALDEGEGRAFEEHLAAGCEACARELRGCEETAALLALAAPPVAPPASARERLLTRIGEGGKGGGEASEKSGGARGASRFAGASDFLIVRAGEGEWMETPDPGVFVKLLFVDKERDTVTTLLRLEPGASIAPHRHLGVEQCLVLEGVMHAGDVVLRAGDFNCAAKGSVHEEIRSESGGLLLIVSPESYESLGRAGA